MAFSNDSTVVILGLYAAIFVHRGFSRAKTYRSPHKALPWHIVSGALEIILYYAGFDCSMVAVVACFVHSWSSLMLVKNMRRGYTPVTRPAYQAGSVIRPIAMLYAYISRDPVAYHDAIMPIHGFVYTRALIFSMNIMDPTISLRDNLTYIYGLAISVGAVMGVGHCSSPYAVFNYLLVVTIIGRLSLWVRQKIEAREKLAPPFQLPLYLRALKFVGFYYLDAPKSSQNKTAPEHECEDVDADGATWSTATPAETANICLREGKPVAADKTKRLKLRSLSIPILDVTTLLSGDRSMSPIVIRSS